VRAGKPMGRFPFPPVLLVVDAIGALLFGVGVAALVADLSGLAPVLASQNVAGALVAIGGAAMVFAGLKIVQHLRAARTGDRSR
jgi:uncharacterized membrane protein YidH (DUF202 family)